MELTLKSKEGEDKVEIPDELWERFENKAKELDVPAEKLFELVLSAYLEKRGY